jgi:hypothetical protein
MSRSRRHPRSRPYPDGHTHENALWPVCLLALLTLIAFTGPAAADSEATVADTHPAAEARLAPNETFYVLISYTTDEPISLWARPFLNGKEVLKVMTNPSSPHEGSGEALGWFQLTEPGYVDEVRIKAGGGKPYREWEIARYPVQLEWRASGKARPRPEFTGGDMAFFSGFMLFMLALGIGGLIVPVWTARKWQGGWRIAALVPVVVMGFVILRILFDTARDPTSHNLWPFEIIMFGGIALAVIVVLKLLRKMVGADEQSR